jgi:dipeptidyl aminopeptidase/acylaminoacyl peptidase
MQKLNYFFITMVPILFFACSGPKEKVTTSDFTGSLTEAEIKAGKLTPELLWKFGRVSDAQLSVDGKLVAYTVTRYDYHTNKKNTDLYTVNADNKEVKRITDLVGDEFNPRWIPGKNRIGFLSGKSGSVQLWEINADGSDLKQISNIPGDINSFEYCPTGNGVFYTQNVKLDSSANDIYPDLPLANVKMADDLMYRHWNKWHDYTYSHIFVAKYANSEITESKDIMKDEKYDSPLAPDYDAAEIAWSPDGKTIAYTCKKLKGRDYAISTNSDIYLYNLSSGNTRNISEGMPGYDRCPAFSPDGKQLLWLSMETAGYESDKNRLMLYNMASGLKTDLTKDYDQNVSNVCWNADGSKIYCISGIHATFQVCSIDPVSREVKTLTQGWHDYTSLRLAGNSMVGEKMSMSMATEIFKIDPTSGKETQLTFTNKNIYDAVKMGRVEQKWVKTTDNKQMLVWLILPPDFDASKKYPAILFCQGGPQSAVSQFFSYRWNFQLMAANGYVIIAPNRRGLPTFGKEWNDQIAGDYGGQNMKDYLSAVDAVKTEPYIDANRLGAAGASYGGFSVYWLAGHHQKRFKAFLAHCGMFNLESQYAETEEVFFTNHDLGGAYWQNPKPKSYNYSPHLFVKDWDTPIMMISGENDFRIPYTETLQAFNCAQLRGIPSKLLIFPDESHFVLKPQNSILWQREFFKWFDKWLK